MLAYKVAEDPQAAWDAHLPEATHLIDTQPYKPDCTMAPIHLVFPQTIEDRELKIDSLSSFSHLIRSPPPTAADQERIRGRQKILLTRFEEIWTEKRLKTRRRLLQSQKAMGEKR
jgi:hypothetical protein